MNPAFVGREVAREITAVYWSKNSFMFTSTGEFKEAMANDPFGLGMSPFDHIRTMTILLEYGYGSHADSESAYFMQTFEESKSLHVIKRKDLLCVEIRLNTDFRVRAGAFELEDECRMLNLLEMIRYPVYELLHAGSKIDIMEYNGDGGDLAERHLTGYPESTQVGAHPNVNFFQMNSNEWAKEKDSVGLWDASKNFVLEENNVLDETKLRNALRERWGKTHAMEGFDYHSDYWCDEEEEEDAEDEEDEDDE
ncbi:hypothetical protein CC86DRAFT_400188 [Ophiobolus disseminans]|uniref:Uncharacterized protein n=1 Tax=Ophiobolus disseminans TaxID=1469910 RepID=A0A6A7AK21_9PLEO|nr:hypothetical protein CC86DRAFT_400188 [Ophiobolus disseminans]